MKTRFPKAWLVLSLLLLVWGCEHVVPTPPKAVVEPPPENTELKLSDFPEPEACATCHPNQYQEWVGSMHAYATTDPAFNSMQEMGQRETEGKLDQFCIQCHSIIVRQLGLTPPLYRNEDLPPIGLRGISCMVCHSVKAVTKPANGELVLDPKSGLRGPIVDPVENGFHKSLYSPVFTNSDLCSGCHNVVSGRGVTIENTFNEWKSGPAAAQGQHCADCHMPEYQGPAAVGGPERMVHRHFFAGVDIALVDFPDKPRQLQLVTELLQSAAEIEVTAPNKVSAGGLLPLTVRITSKTAGHNIPTGAIADRQMWLAVTITEKSTGRVLYRSGHLDANGDLLDRHSELNPNADFDLVAFSQLMVGANGNDVFFSWQAVTERTQTLPPLATVTPEYFIFLPQDISGQLQVDVRLRFRSFAPFILRKLSLPELVEKVPIIDMATWSGEADVE